MVSIQCDSCAMNRRDIKYQPINSLHLRLGRKDLKDLGSKDNFFSSTCLQLNAEEKEKRIVLLNLKK